MTRRRRRAFTRLGDGRIALDLPAGVREFMAAAAERLHDTAAAPGSPGFERLFGRIEETAVLDDPAYVLSRQLAVDELASSVAASARKEVIDADEAEAWLKVLGLTLSRRCAELGIRTEQDRARLDAADEAVLQVVYALQVALIEVLDGGTG